MIFSARQSSRMRRPARALAILSALSLPSCAPLTPSAGPLFAPAPLPESLARPCAPAQSLPPRGLSGAEAARLWARDRLALAHCAGRLEALAEHARGQARAGQAASPSLPPKPAP